MSEKNVSSPKDGAVQSLLITLHDHPGQGARGGITDQLLDFAARLG